MAVNVLGPCLHVVIRIICCDASVSPCFCSWMSPLACALISYEAGGGGALQVARGRRVIVGSLEQRPRATVTPGSSRRTSPILPSSKRT